MLGSAHGAQQTVEAGPAPEHLTRPWDWLEPYEALIFSFGLLALLMLVSLWALDNLRPRDAPAHQRLKDAGRWLGVHAIPAVAWLSLVALLSFLIASLLGFAEPLSFTQLVTLLALALFAALLPRHGERLMARLTKLGPLEFADQKLDTFAEHLERISSDYDLDPRRGGKLSPSEMYKIQKADLFVNTLEFYDIKTSGLAKKETLYRILMKIAKVAMNTGEWPRSMDRLRLLMELSEGSYKPKETHYRLGVSYWQYALTCEGKMRRELFSEAIGQLRKVLGHDPDDFRSHYLIAFAQDELGRYRQAIASNQKALDLRPASAIIKYNIAISFLNLRQPKDACEQLETMSVYDHRIGFALVQAENDVDLMPLRRSKEWGARVEGVLTDLWARYSERSESDLSKRPSGPQAA